MYGYQGGKGGGGRNWETGIDTVENTLKHFPSSTVPSLTASNKSSFQAKHIHIRYCTLPFCKSWEQARSQELEFPFYPITVSQNIVVQLLRQSDSV